MLYSVDTQPLARVKYVPPALRVLGDSFLVSETMSTNLSLYDFWVRVLITISRPFLMVILNKVM